MYGRDIDPQTSNLQDHKNDHLRPNGAGWPALAILIRIHQYDETAKDDVDEDKRQRMRQQRIHDEPLSWVVGLKKRFKVLKKQYTPKQLLCQ